MKSCSTPCAGGFVEHPAKFRLASCSAGKPGCRIATASMDTLAELPGHYDRTLIELGRLLEINERNLRDRETETSGTTKAWAP